MGKNFTKINISKRTGWVNVLRDGKDGEEYTQWDGGYSIVFGTFETKRFKTPSKKEEKQFNQALKDTSFESFKLVKRPIYSLRLGL